MRGMTAAIEHVAWQVRDPAAVADWYVKNLNFRIVRHGDAESRTHFLADACGRVVVEIYNNPAAHVPDYPSIHFLQLHIAFTVDDPAATRDAMLAAGATIAEELRTTPAGDQLLMMRDPFGFAIQFVKRAKPLM
jgi:glyoxylase I family protein